MKSNLTNKTKLREHNTGDDLQHLGFNGGQGGVKITEEVNQGSGKSYQSIIIGTFALMVFLGTTIPRRSS